MRKLICVVNQKGGVGKTYCCTHLARALFLRGKRVLLVDLDPQYNSSKWAFANQFPPEAHIDLTPAAFTEHLFTETGITPTPLMSNLGFDVLLASKRIQLVQKYDDDALYNFKENIELVADSYDYIFFDSPPTIGNLMKAQLITCNYVIIPTQLEKDSFEQMKELYQTIETVKARQNPTIEVLGVLMNGEGVIRDKNGAARNLTAIYFEDEINSWAASLGKNLVFSERWHVTSVGKKARTLDTTVIDYEPASLSAMQVMSTVDEIEARL